MKKDCFTITLLFLACRLSFSHVEMCNLRVSLNDKSYHKLELSLILENNRNYIVEGKTEDNVNWIFHYPDSIYDMHMFMKLFGSITTESIRHKIFIYIPITPDTLKTESFSVSKKSGITEFFINSQKVKIQNKKYYADDFYFSNKEDSLMCIAAEAMNKGFSMFWRDTLIYHQQIEKYQNIVLNYPEAHFLVSSLYGNIGRYKEKKDISLIFNHFSNNKSSFFGKKINDYLSMNFFENSILQNWQTNKLERIIQDTTRYNLLFFSASWCGPCYNQIRNLKKIYNDLQENINTTYVSIDEAETIGEWKKLMKREQIPWRSLLSEKDVKGLQNKYFIHSIPLAFLIFPNGKIQRLKLYEEKNRKLIYAITNLK